MGSSPTAILAYGYDIGGAEDWKIREAGEYGDPTVAWYNDDEDADGFVTQAENRLLVASGFTETDWQVDGYHARKREAENRLGVTFRYYCSFEYSSYVLATKVITVDWGETELLDLPKLMAEPAEQGWDDKLAAALCVLEITPNQERPGWGLYAFYG